MPAPMISFKVDGEPGNDAKIEVSAQDIGFAVLKTEQWELISDWLTEVFNGESIHDSLEIHANGKVIVG